MATKFRDEEKRMEAEYPELKVELKILIQDKYLEFLKDYYSKRKRDETLNILLN